MRHPRALLVALLTAFSLPLGVASSVAFAKQPAPNATSPSLTGRWDGKIQLPGLELGFDADFTIDAGAVRGDISIPMQGAKDIPLEKISIDADRVTFALAGVPGDPTFNGTFSADGNEISGDFTQGPVKAAFTMKRGVDPAVAAGDALAGFDAWLDSARDSWKVPGVAVAIVKDGAIVYAGAAGKRDVESDLAMTPDTLLAIGSATKAFTTMVLATIAEEGKLEWDRPVRHYMPDFAIADEDAARQMTTIDLVTHRSGMPRHDLMWYTAAFTREEIFARLRYLPSSKPQRTEFQYNNLMYLAAGVLAERLTGMTWEDAVRARIFAPLGMSRSVFSPVDAQRDADYAAAYRREDDDTVKRIPYRDIPSMGPAGTIYSSVNEMSRWVIAHVAPSAGARLVSDSALQKLHSPHMHMGGPPAPPDQQLVKVGYGLGWFVDVYRGHRRVHHGGNIDGFSALVVLLPDDNAGMVILTNLDANPLPGIVARHAADRILGLEPVDWNAKALGERAAAKALEDDAKAKKKTVRKEGARPAHDLAEYAGEYEHPGYGVITITESAGSLTFAFNRISAPLEHWHYDVFNCLKNPDDPVFEDVKILFLTGMDGEVEALRVSTDPNVDETIFTRRPDAELTDPAFLSRLAGTYMLGPSPVTCELRGDRLWAVLPGQPPYELEPKRNRTFALKALSGFSLRFDLDESGAVKSATFIQPNGVFTATRKE